jgi:hypothetical protein
MAYYRKKPVVVQAFRFGMDEAPDWFVNSDQGMTFGGDPTLKAPAEGRSRWVEIEQEKGYVTAILGDYIVLDRGNITRYAPDQFAATYEPVDADFGAPPIDVVSWWANYALTVPLTSADVNTFNREITPYITSGSPEVQAQLATIKLDVARRFMAAQALTSKAGSR